MKYFTPLVILCLSLMFTPGKAQDLYFDEQFDVEVESGLTYGVNATVLFYSILGEAVPEELIMDVYSPVNSGLDEHPLVVLAHSGTFLPFPLNQLTNGTRSDSVIVEIATRLASRGYVVASIDYRLGWQVDAPTQEQKTDGLINAAYRALQDSRTCARYFRKSVEEEGNPFAVDTSRFVFWGVGTGGYISYAVATLDDYNEVLVPKFFKENPFDPNLPPIPMIIEDINGDINGTSVGINPLDGDTLCYANHVGYSSEFDMVIAQGGAWGDTSWIDENSIPLMTYQVPTDPFAPYLCGTVILPPPLNDPVIDVCGGLKYHQKANDGLTVNAVFQNEYDWEDYSEVAEARAGLDGLFPLIGDSPVDSGPWDWWNPDTNPNHATGLLTNPNMSPEKGRSYVDTIMAYFYPRACVTLDLGACKIVSSTDEVSDAQIGLNISPNPSVDGFFFQTDAAYQMEEIQLFDLTGRLLATHRQINNNQYYLERNGLQRGIYLARIQVEEGIITKKIVLE